MRSELIHEIFSVESEAENLVSEARQQGRTLVATAQQEGENRLRKATEQARQTREMTVEQAQIHADQCVQSEKETLIQSGEDTLDLQKCAEQIAQDMVTLLCTSSVGELNP